MQTKDAPPELRNLRETLAAHQQEVQDTHAWLKRTYAALDEQASHAAQDSIGRYLRNVALLGQIFSGPGRPPEPLGGQTDIAELAARVKETAATRVLDVGVTGKAGEVLDSSHPDMDPLDSQAGIKEFLALLERIKGAISEADLEECKQEHERQKKARKRRRMCAGAQGPGEDGAQESWHERIETLVSPGLYKAELLEDEQAILSGGEQDSPIRL